MEMIQLTMQSERIGDTFHIDISLPTNYDVRKRYPVIYLTDGYWRVGEHPKIHAMSDQGTIQEVIVVGIGYPQGYEVGKIRERDLLGGADRFLAFIVEQIIPHIDEHYSTDPAHRTLWGASHGGYFVTYCLFQYLNHTQNIFRDYIINSPTLWNKTNGFDAFEMEQNLYDHTKQLPVNVYYTVGGLESEEHFVGPFRKMVAQIESRHYAGLRFSHYIDPDKTHETVWEPALMEGIRMFLGK